MDQQQLKVYEHQLEQVRERISLKPDDEALRGVERKLLTLISLYKSLRSQETKGPKTRLVPSAAEPRGNEKQKAPSRSGVMLKIGESCQALDQEGGWAAATIQSVSADRQHATVIFSKSSSARHCSWQEVREPPSVTTISGEKQQSETASRKRDSQQALGVEPPTKATEGQPAKRSRPSSRTEYVRRKEEEHREKQDAWKSFSKKFGLGAAKPSSSSRKP